MRHIERMAERRVTPPEDIALLRETIEASGLTVGRWARRVAWRDRNTVRDWLAGRHPVPQVVLDGIRAAVTVSRETEADPKEM